LFSAIRDIVQEILLTLVFCILFRNYFLNILLYDYIYSSKSNLLKEIVH
jgi:hypothetical protein